MEHKQSTYARDWLDNDFIEESLLKPEEKDLAGRIMALGAADRPDDEFTARLIHRLLAQETASKKLVRKPLKDRRSFQNGVKLAGRWALGLFGIVLLVGFLVFSIRLLPQKAGAPAPVQPSLAGPVFTPLPVGPTATLPPQTYVVRDGDTWNSIASTFGVSVQELMTLNGIRDPGDLFVGQTLVVSPQNNSVPNTETGQAPTESAAAEPIPAALVADACPLSPDLPANSNHYPPSQRPEAIAGGGVVENGSFTFEIWLACGKMFTHENTLGDHFTEIEGLGFFSFATYHGPELEGPITHYSGIQPYVRETSSGDGAVTDGYGMGDMEGLQFPVGIIPDFSQSDTRLRYVAKVQTPDGGFAGAALVFTLQREAEGYRPVDIAVEPLASDELGPVVYDPSAPAPFPTKDVERVYPELKEMRVMLDRWQAPLLAEAGWLHRVTRQEEPGGNGLYGSLTEWVTEDWSQIDEGGYLVAFVTLQRAQDGRVLQQVYTHNGQTVNLTFGGVYNFTPYRYDLGPNLLTDLFQLLKANRPLVRREASLDGRPVWVWELSFEADGRVQRETFDRRSGAHLASELVTVQPGGEEELVWRYSYEVVERAEPPAEILEVLGQEFQGYIPAAPQGTPAPEGFDPSDSELTLRSIPGDSFERPTRFFGDLYAGDYLLGRVDFGARPGGNCDRSADGSRLAYGYEVLEGERLSSATLRWLDLRDIQQVHEVRPELQLFGRAAWSPAADQIAFSACTGLVDGRYQGCGVYLYDLPADQLRLLTNAGATVWDILWKPDGTQIAFVSTIDEGHPYFVLDIASGKILAQGQFDADAWQFPADSPVASWGIPYPRGSGGSGCFRNP